MASLATIVKRSLDRIVRLAIQVTTETLTIVASVVIVQMELQATVVMRMERPIASLAMMIIPCTMTSAHVKICFSHVGDCVLSHVVSSHAWVLQF